jgi:hypothetical protein
MDGALVTAKVIPVGWVISEKVMGPSLVLGILQLSQHHYP